eukprot:TRINITY_DN28847_c0_g1_i1.p1 TRINITY_DN28847_c0_g1~~TRINITY_DN28847_c0_g1_i1.p1  ORF type:complete len:831 (+),score=191.22 TRINITY_DN28847_c0_g1_i1:62-2494(+)
MAAEVSELQHATVAVLKDWCRDFGISPLGNKRAIVQQLLSHLCADEDALAAEGESPAGEVASADALNPATSAPAPAPVAAGRGGESAPGDADGADDSSRNRSAAAASAPRRKQARPGGAGDNCRDFSASDASAARRKQVKRAAPAARRARGGVASGVGSDEACGEVQAKSRSASAQVSRAAEVGGGEQQADLRSGSAEDSTPAGAKAQETSVVPASARRQHAMADAHGRRGVSEGFGGGAASASAVAVLRADAAETGPTAVQIPSAGPAVGALRSGKRPGPPICRPNSFSGGRGKHARRKVTSTPDSALLLRLPRARVARSAADDVVEPVPLESTSLPSRAPSPLPSPTTAAPVALSPAPMSAELGLLDCLDCSDAPMASAALPAEPLASAVATPTALTTSATASASASRQPKACARRRPARSALRSKLRTSAPAPAVRETAVIAAATAPEIAPARAPARSPEPAPSLVPHAASAEPSATTAPAASAVSAPASPLERPVALTSETPGRSTAGTLRSRLRASPMDPTSAFAALSPLGPAVEPSEANVARTSQTPGRSTASSLRARLRASAVAGRTPNKQRWRQLLSPPQALSSLSPLTGGTECLAARCESARKRRLALFAESPAGAPGGRQEGFVSPAPLQASPQALPESDDDDNVAVALAGEGERRLEQRPWEPASKAAEALVQRSIAAAKADRRAAEPRLVDLGTGMLHSLPNDGVVDIGCAEGCHIRMAFSLVDARHCILLCERGRVSVEDLGELGTFVNDTPLPKGSFLPQRIPLRRGDILALGDPEGPRFLFLNGIRPASPVLGGA